MSSRNNTTLTYFGTRAAAHVFINDARDIFRDVDRSKQLVHPEDIVGLGVSMLGLLVVGVVS